ncbi:hypothetical protein SAICODRAFT_96010 [Saitoella complicata NRRL Y-17804]|nr:uncharacterized protein SAICODRAFT_96010 [Saitoella complicata NRRL Y-17804]ODQ50979.1 hypothetical protein SAICODRAFT_96010 [Saitoella complicata NRRL Y-17804]
MGKKGAKSKKGGDDYWDDAFEQDVDPIKNGHDDAAAAEDSEVEEAGGLMAQMKIAKDKKKKRGGKAAAAVEDDEPPTPEEPAEEVSKAPVEVTEISDDEYFAPKKGKKAKKGGKPATPAAEEEEEAPAAPAEEFRVKTKAEKEREKKERDKAKKKAQAEKKKGGAGAAKAEATATTPTEEKKEDDSASAGAKKGGKKLPAHIAALQKAQEERRRQEELQRQAEEEERKRLEEIERQEAEEEAKREEVKRLKKEKEKAKKEQLRAEGKLLSKKQKEQQAQAQRRLQQLLDSGVKVEGLAAEEEEEKKPKKVVYTSRNKKKQEEEAKKKADEEAKRKVEEEAKRKAEEEAKKEGEDEDGDDLLEDWEAALGSDGEVKDAWDAPSEDEKEEATPEEITPEAEEEDEDDEDEGSDEDSNDDSDSDSDSDSDDDSSDEEQSANQRMLAQRKAEAAKAREERHKSAMAARSADNLRSPIACILGHVDTGKTKLLDKIRQTNVQEGEAGGITQQIGATYFPMDAIVKKTAVLDNKGDFEFKLPGLLVIDTPGHESFTNLRSRGSSLCNIAVLVVDIMHGLEPQTLESIRLLKERKTPFIVALNKIDRLYGWDPTPNGGFEASLAKQKKTVQREFQDRLEKTQLAFAEQGLNSQLFSKNKNMAKYVSLVPTSAHTGEGIPDLLFLLCKLTQERMTGRLMFVSELECTVLEVKMIEGLGTTIDVVLVNGVLHEGDKIVVCGINGPIVTHIRALLTPQPMKELRVKSAYVHHKSIKAAMGVKISANDLDKAIAGSRLFVCGPDDDEEELKDAVMEDLQDMLSRIDTTDRGVCVQASTLGALEALLEFLRTSKIPVSGINIGPVYKKDVMRAGAMLEKNKEFAVLLCFDVKVDKDAQHLADEAGVKIFTADIIYHLFDQFTEYQTKMLEQKRVEGAAIAVYPCVLRTVAVFARKDPILLGCDVVEGALRVGTPICTIKDGEVISLGNVTSIESNHKSVDVVKKGQAGGGVAVKIEGQNQPLIGRQVSDKDPLYSQISRKSIDVLKDPAFRDSVSKEEWALIVQLKKVFGIL